MHVFSSINSILGHKLLFIHFIGVKNILRRRKLFIIIKRTVSCSFQLYFQTVRQYPYQETCRKYCRRCGTV